MLVGEYGGENGGGERKEGGFGGVGLLMGGNMGEKGAPGEVNEIFEMSFPPPPGFFPC